MTVAVQKGHEMLKDELRNLGYDVVTFGEFTGIIDALIYSGSLENGALNQNNFDMYSIGNYSDNARGILMINIENKSVDEIDVILKKRVYSPLF